MTNRNTQSTYDTQDQLQWLENMLHASRHHNERLQDIIASLHKELGDAYKANLEQRQRHAKQLIITILVCAVLLITSLSFYGV